MPPWPWRIGQRASAFGQPLGFPSLLEVFAARLLEEPQVPNKAARQQGSKAARGFESFVPEKGLHLGAHLGLRGLDGERRGPLLLGLGAPIPGPFGF